MSQPFMQMTDENTGMTFRWHGGEYVSIGYVQSQGVDGIDGDDFHAYDVINVWDYAAGRPNMPRELSAFQDRCERWMLENTMQDA